RLERQMKRRSFQGSKRSGQKNTKVLPLKKSELSHFRNTVGVNPWLDENGVEKARFLLFFFLIFILLFIKPGF
ncbi:MAG: hypothetical protein FWF29_13075, partial [Treponema sp.]|nr:hypothetical protein [Treponema sp.]